MSLATRQNGMERVIVTDGETRAALAAVRSLGRAGYTVCLTATRQPSLAGASRFVSHRVQLAAAAANPARAMEELAALVSRWGADVVIPVTDASIAAILRQCGPRIGRAVVAGPSLEAYEALANKAALLERARALGVAVPRTVTARSPAELATAAAAVGYPCVLKPHRSWVSGEVMVTTGEVRVAETPTALAKSFPDAAYPILVQKRIEGPGEGIFLLMDDGRRTATFAHRRLREKPPSGGVSTYRESIPPPEDLVDAAEALLGDVGWQGVAMVEFKRSARVGRGYLMEVNGRLWGSLQLAIDAGVDFPVLLVRTALRQPVTPVTSYRTGVRTRWFWGDVDHLIARLRYSREQLHLGPEAPSVAGVARDFLRFWRRGDRWEVWDRDDPWPFWRETVDWFRGRSA
jgi:predicted ATP-grasp superfamily ATP-dependent carboligase